MNWVAWVAVGAAVLAGLANVAAVLGWLLARKVHRWQREYDKPQVEITRIFPTAKDDLAVEIVNTGNRDLFIRTVGVEGAGQPPMILIEEERERAEHSSRAMDRPLKPEQRRIYSRSLASLNRFVGQHVHVVVRSNLSELARMGIRPDMWGSLGVS